MGAEKSEFGHRKMIVWQNLDKAEFFIRQRVLPSIPKYKYSMIDQIDRSCSSSVANFIEGYYSGAIKEYLRFLSYSKRSMAELQDWVRRSHYDRFITAELFQEFDDLAIRTIYLLNRLISSLKQKVENDKIKKGYKGQGRP
ncbi:MAG: four helix bundle protein [Candidatus Margulisbacteria bacterium]|nr:four helix bundle protein [Candidatus Margulisiibacteriota bacterium]